VGELWKHSTNQSSYGYQRTLERNMSVFKGLSASHCQARHALNVTECQVWYWGYVLSSKTRPYSHRVSSAVLGLRTVKQDTPLLSQSVKCGIGVTYCQARHALTVTECQVRYWGYVKLRSSFLKLWSSTYGW
jgi:hypothetical protein